MPSAKARALGDPIEVDLTGLLPGAVRAHLYRGETMLVLRRTPAMLGALAATEPLVLHDGSNPEYADPRYVDPHHRAITPNSSCSEACARTLAACHNVRIPTANESSAAGGRAGSSAPVISPDSTMPVA
jgi:ubiquinol-cytochrome c reductase iron-sulfur subunit